MMKVVSSSPKSVFFHPSIENKCSENATASPYTLNISPNKGAIISLLPQTSPVLATTTRKNNKRHRQRNSFLRNFPRTKNTLTTNDDNNINPRSSSTSITTLSESYSTTIQNTQENNHHLPEDSTITTNRIVALTEKRPSHKNDESDDECQNNAKRQKRHRRTSTSLFFGDVACKEETRILNNSLLVATTEDDDDDETPQDDNLRREALLLCESSSQYFNNAPGILKQIFSEDSVVHYSPTVVGGIDETCDNVRLQQGRDVQSAPTHCSLAHASMPTKYASPPAASLHFSIKFHDEYFDDHAGENQPSGISFCQLNDESKDDLQPHDDAHRATTTTTTTTKVVPNDCRELLSALTLNERSSSGSSLLRQIFPENNIKIVDEFSF